MAVDKLFSEFRILRKKIDALVIKLNKTHSAHMSCKKGCDNCCMSFSVLPIEFFSILDEIKSTGFSFNPDANDNDCPFLTNHECSIYDSRPVICRTHGLPLLYMNEEGTGWEFSTCELNFTDFDPENFTEDSFYPQDRFNSEMFMINQQFIKEFSEENFSENELIPLKELLNKV